MEQKNLNHTKSLSLLTYQLKEKKNWFIVSIAIMFTTLVAVPLALNGRIDESSVAIGILEIATLLFISTLIDCSYLHDNRKLSYYFSKPVTRINRIWVIIAANAVYASVLLIFLMGIAFLSNSAAEQMFRFFLLFVPWVFIALLITVLSSLLTGNTIAAGVATVINFTLPLSLLGIIHFGFDVVGNITNGFNSRVLFNLFIENIYRIDLLYFIKYMESGFSPDYLLVLAFWMVTVGFLIVYTVKKRQDEKSGEFIIFDGYKNMVSVLVSSLVPIGFYTMFSFNVNVYNKLLSFAILSALTFYLLHAILEKSFKIGRPAVKIYTVFILFFGALLLTTNVAAKSFEKVVPEASEVSSVYFHYRNYIWTEEKLKMIEVYQATEDIIDKSPNAWLYKDPKDIENVIGFHNEIIKNKEFYFSTNLVIVYFYHDGSKMYRFYDLRESVSYDKQKDSYLMSLISSQEYQQKTLSFVFDKEFFKDFTIGDVRVITETYGHSRTDTEIGTHNFDPEIFREKLERDYERLINDTEFALRVLFFDRYEEYIKRELTTGEPEAVSADRTVSYYVELIPGYGSVQTIEPLTFRITEQYTETFHYLDILKKEGSFRNEDAKSILPIEDRRVEGNLYNYLDTHQAFSIV